MGGFAWVTLATNDSYSLGALVLGHSLRRVGSKHDLAVLITPGVTQPMREKLSAVFSLVQEVNVLDSRDETNLALLARPELGITFTKLHCWRLTQYDKCVFVDADTLVVRNCDELFEREELSAAPDVGWPDCFNSGVFVFKPSQQTFASLTAFAASQGSFDGGDQGLLNSYFSDWAHKDISKHLPFIYNMCSTATYSYLPAYKQFGENVRIIHFIGSTKPWLQYFDSVTGQVQPSPGSNHLAPLLQLWWNIFCESVHPQLSPVMASTTLAPHWHVTQIFPDPIAINTRHYVFHDLTDEISDEVDIVQPDFSEFHDPWEDYVAPQHFSSGQNEPPVQAEHFLSGSHSNDDFETRTTHYERNPIDFHEYHPDRSEHHADYHHENNSGHHHEHRSDNHHEHNSGHHYEHNPGYHNDHNSEHYHEHNPGHHYERNSGHHEHHEYSSHREHIFQGVDQPNHHAYHSDNSHAQHPSQSNHPTSSEPPVYRPPSVNIHPIHPQAHHPPTNHQINQPKHQTYATEHYEQHQSYEHTQSSQVQRHQAQAHYEQHRSHEHSQNSEIQGNQTQYHNYEERGENTQSHHQDNSLHHLHDRPTESHDVNINSNTDVSMSKSQCHSESTTMNTDQNTSGGLENSDSGIAGALARLTLGEVRSPEQIALEEHMRKCSWEQGQIDYMGRDSFDNIWKKICTTLDGAPQREKTPLKEKTPPVEKTKESSPLSSTETAVTTTEEEVVKEEEAIAAEAQPENLPQETTPETDPIEETTTKIEQGTTDVSQTTEVSSTATPEKSAEVLRIIATPPLLPLTSSPPILSLTASPPVLSIKEAGEKSLIKPVQPKKEQKAAEEPEDTRETVIPLGYISATTFESTTCLDLSTTAPKESDSSVPIQVAESVLEADIKESISEDIKPVPEEAIGSISAPIQESVSSVVEALEAAPPVQLPPTTQELPLQANGIASFDSDAKSDEHLPSSPLAAAPLEIALQIAEETAPGKVLQERLPVEELATEPVPQPEVPSSPVEESPKSTEIVSEISQATEIAQEATVLIETAEKAHEPIAEAQISTEEAPKPVDQVVDVCPVKQPVPQASPLDEQIPEDSAAEKQLLEAVPDEEQIPEAAPAEEQTSEASPAEEISDKPTEAVQTLLESKSEEFPSELSPPIPSTPTVTGPTPPASPQFELSEGQITEESKTSKKPAKKVVKKTSSEEKTESSEADSEGKKSTKKVVKKVVKKPKESQTDDSANGNTSAEKPKKVIKTVKKTAKTGESLETDTTVPETPPPSSSSDVPVPPKRKVKPGTTKTTRKPDSEQ